MSERQRIGVPDDQSKAEDILALLLAIGLMFAGAMWGALLAVSIILSVLMPNSLWSLGVVGCAFSLLGGLLWVLPR